MAKRRPKPASPADRGPILTSVELLPGEASRAERYPFAIPVVRALAAQGTLPLDPRVTFLVGENGAGKSTLLEALAVAAGFNPEGGTRSFAFSTRASESSLHAALRLSRARRERDGFFLRAESLFNVATNIEELDREPPVGDQPRVIDSYGGRSLHEQSHGESFLALAQHRWGDDGLFFLDEPESALSPSRQLTLLALVDDHVRRRGSQFVIATHSPILMAYPRATILELSRDGLRTVRWDETEHYRVTRDFLASPERFFKHLFAPEG